MTDTESKAMDIVNALLENKKIPIDRVKSINLKWESIYGEFLPVLKYEFYEDKATWRTTTNE